ncbi:sensor histidine kinase [Ferruginivarius sediminum]|uniref:histidine kinase n=1 Tax=Ferruginivarius sediminum TaxID=2661937 RepID=A0A369T854_9PROT|nr:HAMP domain-containing sensor histidine kinase [Ferruginivarius sediminum]RDD60357.1 sensor histidine kinase [Ferruginivarius sediminum]
MNARSLNLPHVAKGLSARLLVLTIFFVMLAEVMIFVPSIARYRLNYLEEKLANGHLAMLALQATPDQAVGEAIEKRLLSHAGAYSVALREPGERKLILMQETPQRVDATYDLREAGTFQLIGDAFSSLLGPGDRRLRVIGTSPQDGSAMVEVVVDEAPLCRAMLAFGERILGLSLVISLFAAALVYLSLHMLLVRPMRRLTESMTRFREDPEDLSNHIRPSARTDEVGVAEHELASMQERLTAALHQKARLAALGIAVTKINHDLKNILSTARLISDRLSESDDPEVRRVTPTLVKAIDRAVNLCVQTLNFSREGPPQLNLTRFDLGELVEDVGFGLPASEHEGAWRNMLPEGLELEADRDQLYRVFANIGRNAIEAGASRVSVRGEETESGLSIRIEDDGPGLPPRAYENIFQPFAGTVKQGGTGLGLAIARDLVRAHGGDIRLEQSTAEGTSFRIDLPRRQQHGHRGASAGRKRAAR